ncbi:sugar ABC transporter substrate-binding protein [Caproiciproducens sp. NJN-50]|uniref:sugar ABC transporter substrate-binding protein n=1 Tax=Acutalibacteraceae TaxID=3082771 RepID=UPI000FFE2885|nr:MULTISPECIES: sugar ABC transporter substrate-binding protein [Acutalibacteraceae]QAT48983.1 sugar ABC transporter substrate-binding protein [Caproiciproducens sp. NJN-50]
MKKRCLAILLAVSMVVPLAACSSQNSSSTTSGAAANTASTAETSGGAAAANGGSNEIWYSTKNSTETVHVAMAKGVTDAAKMLGYDGKVTVAESDAAKQNDQMNNLIDNVKPKAIILNPYDSDSVSDVITKCNNAKIPLAVIDNQANNANVAVSVLFDSIASGKAAAEEAIRLLTQKYGKPKGVVVDLYGEVVSQVFKDRAKGFEDEIKKYSDIKLISVLGAPQADVATSALNNIIADSKSRNETIDLINTPTDTATLGAVEALKTNDMWYPIGNDKHVFVISHDGASQILDDIRDNYVDSEIVIDVLGVGGIAAEVLNEYTVKGKEIPTSGTFEPRGKYLNKKVEFSKGNCGPTIVLAPLKVTKTNADDPLIWGNVVK